MTHKYPVPAGTKNISISEDKAAKLLIIEFEGAEEKKLEKKRTWKDYTPSICNLEHLNRMEVMAIACKIMNRINLGWKPGKKETVYYPKLKTEFDDSELFANTTNSGLLSVFVFPSI